jgi:hypothetical protein
MVIPSAVFSTIVIEPAMIESVVIESFTFESFMVEPSTAEIASIVSFEIRAVVFIVDTVAVVATPCGVVVVNIPWEFVLIYDGGWCLRITVLAVYILVVLILANRGRGGGRVLLINYGRRRCVHIDPDPGYTEPDVGADIYLRVGRVGDKGSAKDRCKNKQLFHFRRF